MRMMMIIPIQERLYLFVHDQDHPAAAPRDRSNVPAVYSYIGMSAVIPCKPAHPEFQVRLRKDSLELYDGAFDHIPHLGFVVPNITDTNLAGKFECLFTSNHYFEQSRYVEMIIEPNLRRTTDGRTTVHYGRGRDDDRSGSGSGDGHHNCGMSQGNEMIWWQILISLNLIWGLSL